MRGIRMFVWLTLAYVLGSSCLLAQATSQINGAVRDSSGLSIPGAQIKATQTATGLVRTTTSSGDGAYVLTNLAIGPYLLE